MIRTYQEITSLPTFLERYHYARTGQKVGEDTFGFDRWLNQLFYSSPEWKELRRYVILRDEGCDLAHQGYPIEGRIYVHHLNPISKKDILERSEFALNPDFFICTSPRRRALPCSTLRPMPDAPWRSISGRRGRMY